MKRLGWILVLLMMATPAWAAKKITVQQLKDLLVSLQQEKKDDAAVAAELKQVEPSEQMDRATLNSLVSYVPGPMSTEQVYVLEARSALLLPPASDLPTTAAPDATAQQAILAKAADYVGKTYAQLPHFSATKITARFQDNIEAVADSSGMHSAATDVSTNSAFTPANLFVRYINQISSPVESSNGAEKSSYDDKTRWGANGQTAQMGQPPVLTTVLQEAQAAGRISFLRWEKVSGIDTAVFAYSVDKKKSHYAILDCCFPDLDQTGSMRFSTATSGPGTPTVKGNLQTNTNWKPFKASAAYHGELFVDPGTGTVLRLITQPELKATDNVHQEDTRIDYGPATIDGKILIVPTKTFVISEVVPNGDSGAGKYSTRHTFLTSEYKDYK